MKINFLNTPKFYSIKQKNQTSFCSYNSSSPNDVFIKSLDASSQGIDIEYFNKYVGNANLLPESKELLKESTAALFYFDNAKKNLYGLKHGAYSFERFNEVCLAKISETGKKAIKKALSEAKINSKEDLISLIETYIDMTKNKKGVTARGTNFIQMYGSLENPSNIKHFSGILEELLISNMFADTNFDLNSYMELAQELKIKNEEEFYRIFAHLKKILIT